MKRMICLVMVLIQLLLPSLAIRAEEGDNATPVYIKVDLDLSKMNATMAYAQIYNMMFEPENYLGKIVRIAGWYDMLEEQATGMIYYSCMIPDATACCSQGLEFIWPGDDAGDGPELGAKITVTGRLEAYMEGNYQFLHLVDTVVVWENTAME